MCHKMISVRIALKCFTGVRDPDTDIITIPVLLDLSVGALGARCGRAARPNIWTAG